MGRGVGDVSDLFRFSKVFFFVGGASIYKFSREVPLLLQSSLIFGLVSDCISGSVDFPIFCNAGDVDVVYFYLSLLLSFYTSGVPPNVVTFAEFF